MNERVAGGPITSAALAAPGRSLPLAALTVVALVAFGVAGTRLALARVYRSVSGQKLAPI